MKYSNIEFEVNIPEKQIACELESNVVDLPQRTVKEHIEYALDKYTDLINEKQSIDFEYFKSELLPNDYIEFMDEINYYG